MHNAVHTLITVLICPSNFYAARILRAIRVGARLGFSISKETAHFVKNLSGSVSRLDKVVKAAVTYFFFFIVYLISMKCS